MNRFGLSLIASCVLVAAPASAQTYQSRTGRVADEVARTIEETAVAVGRVRDSLDRGINDVRFRGPERYAVDACRPHVERYGRMRVDQVRPYKRHSFRVYGVTQGFAGNYGYRSRSSGPRSFTCTVQDDGRVKLKTKRLRRY